MSADAWADALRSVNRSLGLRAMKGEKVTTKKLPRILLTGSPIVFPNMKIPLLIEEMGGIVAGDETCMGEHGIWDPPVITDNSFDGMMRALANRSLRPCPCPTFSDNSQRIYRLKQLIKENQILETTIDNVGPLSLEATNPCDINSTCVVFAQSEVISLVARKYDRRDILAGMHISMARRIGKMMKKSEKDGDVLMTGGGSLNIGLHKAFEEELMRDVFVADYPQFNGAIGAAIIASERG